MNSFYVKLSKFGSMIRRVSKLRRIDMSNYFTVVHPGHPVINPDKEKPKVDFVKGCPKEVRKEVNEILRTVF